MDPHHHSDNLNLSIYAKANKQRIAMEDLKFTIWYTLKLVWSSGYLRSLSDPCFGVKNIFLNKENIYFLQYV